MNLKGIEFDIHWQTLYTFHTKDTIYKYQWITNKHQKTSVIMTFKCEFSFKFRATATGRIAMLAFISDDDNQ